jgi:DNA-directed RNA polymerase subunit RPC12/RpoP
MRVRKEENMGVANTACVGLHDGYKIIAKERNRDPKRA